MLQHVLVLRTYQSSSTEKKHLGGSHHMYQDIEGPFLNSLDQNVTELSCEEGKPVKDWDESSSQWLLKISE